MANDKATDLTGVYQATVAERSAPRRHSEKEDMRRLIRLIMDSPLSKGEVTTVDGLRDISSYKGKNTDVKTRMLLGVVSDALKGDPKSCEFLMKYGGYEPPKEQNITVTAPTIIEDVPFEGAVSEGQSKEVDAVVTDIILADRDDPRE